MHWIYLALAILFEVAGTTALKAAEGFTRPIPVVFVVLGYLAAFFFLGMSLKSLPVGIAYAIWAALGMVLIALMPVALIALKIPSAGLTLLLVGLAALASGILVHLVTLPTELDASFRRALPILTQGGYLKREDRGAARKILTAAAFTYVAASMMGLVNFWWWLRILRP